MKLDPEQVARELSKLPVDTFGNIKHRTHRLEITAALGAFAAQAVKAERLVAAKRNSKMLGVARLVRDWGRKAVISPLLRGQAREVAADLDALAAELENANGERE